ncbi:MAG TPA: hypothetical protein VM869_28025, partial [Enhygromyxa sp.]|nr:hypothetical protein [Enhygromyxa sp.]
MLAGRVRLIFFIVLALAWGMPGRAEAAKPKRKAASSPIHYSVSIPQPTTRYVHVRVEIADAPNDQTTLAMPAWTPGSYLIRDFGKHVYDVAATDLDAHALAVKRVDKQTWMVDNDGEGFYLEYRVYAGELSVRTSYVDDRFALLNGAGVFMYVVNQTDRAAELELVPPAGWGVHTALDPLASATTGSSRYSAPSY